MDEKQRQELIESAKALRHLADCKEAFAAGKRVTYFGEVLVSPVFKGNPSGYKIAPDPVTRPITMDELPKQPFFVRWSLRPSHEFAVTSMHTDGLKFTVGGKDKQLTFSELLALSAEYRDPADGQWKPFSVEVEG